MHQSYVVEKLTNAMDALTFGPGDMRSRLIVAHFCMRTLRDDDFPPQLKQDFAWIDRQMNKHGPLRSYGGIVFRDSTENTMKRIRNVTAVKIAKRISKLYWGMSANQKYS